MNGKDVVECAYVKSDVADSPYFATPIRLGVREEIIMSGG